MTDIGQDVSGTQDGISLFKEGKYEQAIPLLKEYLAANPNSVPARTCLAASYAQTGKKIDAIQEFNTLTTLDPNNAQHFLNLGIAYTGIGNNAKARQSFEHALSINPTHVKARQHLEAVKQRMAAEANSAPDVSAMGAGTSSRSTEDDMLSAQRPSYGAPPPQQTYTPPPPSAASRPFMMEPLSPPAGVNWGGFLLPFFWSIAHGAWLWAAIAFFFTPVASIYLLIKGNEVAFENRDFNSMDQFRAVQRAWVIAGLIIVGISIILNIISYNRIMDQVKRGSMQNTDIYNMQQFPQAPSPSGEIQFGGTQ